MYAKKRTSPILIILLVLVVLLAALVIFMAQFLVVDFRLYPRYADALDLRGESISFRHYDKVRAKLPDCEISWDVPFQEGLCPSDARTLTVTALEEKDLTAISYLQELETVDAWQCRDYALLQQLQEQRPELELGYAVVLGGRSFAPEASEITLDAIADQEIGDLAYLRNLSCVTVTGGGDTAAFRKLQEYCHDRGVDFRVSIGEEIFPDDTDTLTVREITDADLNLLPLMSRLKSLHLASPQASAELVLSLAAAYPQMNITWDQTFGGILLTQDMTQVDLSGVQIEDLNTLEQALAYFPALEQVFLGEQNIDHEQMAQYRSRVREDYKVVWYIRLGDSRPIRTDITYFMPGRDGPVFNDKTSYNIRYCEDLICVDVGHLGVHDVSWLSYLTNLEYLILSWTGITYIDGIENCKKLKFLEMTDCGIRDLAPLKGCTALEDLNFGNTWPDVSALKEMPWLKNIYMIFGSGKKAYELSQALPDTHVVASGDRTVGSGWRKLPNYYAMRDALHANYMSG